MINLKILVRGIGEVYVDGAVKALADMGYTDVRVYEEIVNGKYNGMNIATGDSQRRGHKYEKDHKVIIRKIKKTLVQGGMVHVEYYAGC